MERNFAFVVPASENYRPAITAMFNSLEKLGNKYTVVFISFRFGELPKVSFPVERIEVDGECQVRGTAIERFNVAAQVAPKYEAICLLDADMFFLNPVDLFFDIASHGFIVTGSDGMVIDFNRDYQERYSIDMGSDSFVYMKLHTTAPIFISHENTDWFEALYNARRIDGWDDFLYLNLLGVQMGKDKKMLCMAPYKFSGIHHWQLKPATAVFEKGGIIMTGTEEEIFIVHGKYFDKGWMKDLMPTMERYLRDEQIGERGELFVRNAIRILMNKFVEFLGGPECLPWLQDEDARELLSTGSFV
jgi:hypothetical protein